MIYLPSLAWLAALSILAVCYAVPCSAFDDGNADGF